MKKLTLYLLAALTAFAQVNIQKDSARKLSNGSIVVGDGTSITATGTGVIAATAVPWSGVDDTPTTLAGYGITDAEPFLAAGTTGQYFRGDKTWQTLDASAISGFASAASAAAPVQSVAGRTGAVTLTKTDVGLGNVPNVDATDATNITSGTIPAARLPAATPTVRGTVLATAKNVRDYGAVGDGVTNDTAAIQAVLDLGGAVFIPDSTFCVEDLRITVSGTHLFGTGYGSRLKLLPTSVGSKRVLNIGYPMSPPTLADTIYSNITIRDLRFDGSADAPGASMGSEQELLNPHNTFGLTVSDCWFENGRDDAIDCDYTNKNLTITRNKIDGMQGIGIHLYGCDDSVISFNVIKNVGTHWTPDLGSTHPHAIDVNAYAAAGAPDSGWPRNVLIEGNVIDTATSGIALWNCIGGIVRGNQISNITPSAFTSGDYVPALMTQGEYNTKVFPRGRGIIVSANTRKITVAQNMVDTTSLSGITVSSPLGALITQNQIYSAGTEGITLIQSVGTVISGNLVNNTVEHGINVPTGSSSATITGNVVTGVAPASGGQTIQEGTKAGIYCASINAVLTGNTVTGHAFGITLTSSEYWTMTGNRARGNAVTDVYFGSAGLTGSARGNIFVTGSRLSNTGVATIASGSTEISFSHGLFSNPTHVLVTPTSSLGSATKFWVDRISNLVYINVDTPPGVAVTFAWEAKVNP